MIPGSDDDGSDRFQGGRNPSWIDLPQALHRKMSVFCARQKRKEKKVQWQWMNSPFLGEGKKSGMHILISYPFSVHKAKKVSAKVGRDKGLQSLSHFGVEITIIMVLIVSDHFHGPLEFNFEKINN